MDDKNSERMGELIGEISNLLDEASKIQNVGFDWGKNIGERSTTMVLSQGFGVITAALVDWTAKNCDSGVLPSHAAISVSKLISILLIASGEVISEVITNSKAEEEKAVESLLDKTKDDNMV